MSTEQSVAKIKCQMSGRKARQSIRLQRMDDPGGGDDSISFHRKVRCGQKI